MLQVKNLCSFATKSPKSRLKYATNIFRQKSSKCFTFLVFSGKIFV